MHERYRLREAVRDGRGGALLIAIEGDARLFETWHAAHRESHSRCTAERAFLVQAVMVDDDGNVVFPAEGMIQRTSAKWLPRSIYVQPGVTGKALREWAIKGTQPAHERAAGNRKVPRPSFRRKNLAPETVERIAEIRKDNPTFGTPERDPAWND